ncbi:MAG: hypothetical protein JRG92_04620 [Deltaproteobacteria bacterium]|nr:hypothetical protein [Deltaproteobacteria bacterium]
MEANSVIKLLDWGLLCGAGLYLLLLRPWRPRRMWAGLTPSIDLLFVAGLLLGWASLHYAPPFERFSVWLVDQTELPAMIVAVDDRIAEIEALPEQMWDDLTARFGWTSEAPGPLPPLHAPGVLTSTVLPAVHGVTEVLLRTFVYGGSLIVLAVCQVMRLVTDVRRAIRARASPTSRRALEARLAALEETVLLGQARIGTDSAAT